ncbi:glycosyltransferase family 2 protein [Pectobacterium parmentieri]|nr:glycosyltransferase family 2 protein [Pectobacterium parmentieri]AYH11000.1 glycosyltransferase family 2 protein [Pectobacterium parmentieri]AYH18285.1 glycosyltransferase family 2 protein [Pectobacterium parmentieri]AYH28447.1 glycosyltransferase family 2 protein [Pectobacterium parmentieri]MBI0494554.1 glycosyltransferase family 2 protein [Pectobacterium parmentieri]
MKLNVINFSNKMVLYMKYSFIVPVYNVAPFLEDCLNSLLSNNRYDVEFLIINDGSTDESSYIAEAFCRKNENFFFFTKKNGGLSDARNYGLSKANGEFIIFVDSDDIISPFFIDYVDYVISNEKCDTIYIEHYKFSSKAELIKNDDFFSLKEKNYRKMSKKEIAAKPNFSWARISNKKLYQNNFFPKGLIYEDVVTSPIITQRSEYIIYIDKKIYAYRKRSGSITTISALKQFDLFFSLDVLHHKMKSGLLSKKLYVTAYINLIQSCLVSLARIGECNERRKIIKLINDKYKEINISDVCFSYSCVKFKILALAIRYKFFLIAMNVLLRVLVRFTDGKRDFIT